MSFEASICGDSACFICVSLKRRDKAYQLFSLFYKITLFLNPLQFQMITYSDLYNQKLSIFSYFQSSWKKRDWSGLRPQRVILLKQVAAQQKWTRCGNDGCTASDTLTIFHIYLKKKLKLYICIFLFWPSHPLNIMSYFSIKALLFFKLVAFHAASFTSNPYKSAVENITAVNNVALNCDMYYLCCLLRRDDVTAWNYKFYLHS